MKMKMGVIKVMYDASTESLVIRRYHAKHSLTTANRDLRGSTLTLAAPAPAAASSSSRCVSFLSFLATLDTRNATIWMWPRDWLLLLCGRPHSRQMS